MDARKTLCQRAVASVAAMHGVDGAEIWGRAVACGAVSPAKAVLQKLPRVATLVQAPASVSVDETYARDAAAEAVNNRARLEASIAGAARKAAEKRALFWTQLVGLEKAALKRALKQAGSPTTVQAGSRTMVRAAYERALADMPTSSKLWREYAEWMRLNKVTEERTAEHWWDGVAGVLGRAASWCPFDGAIVAQRLRVTEVRTLPFPSPACC